MIHTYRRIVQPGQFVSFVLAGLEGHDLVSADHLLLEMQAEILSEARGRYSFTPERDDQWDRIKHLLPGSKGWVRPTAGDNRRGAGRPLLHSMTSIIRKWLYSASPKVLHSVREPRLFVEAVLYRYRIVVAPE